MPRAHAYRVEVSGAFSGSAYRYESLLTGSLAKVERFIASVTKPREEAMMLITEGFAGVIDVLVDGERVFRTSFLPALRLEARGRVFVHDGARWSMDGRALDGGALEERYDEIIHAFLGRFRREISLAALGLPEVRGEPLADGVPLMVTNVAGKTYEHVCGQVVGDFGEAHAYA